MISKSSLFLQYPHVENQNKAEEAKGLIWWQSILVPWLWSKLTCMSEGKTGSISAVIPRGRGPWGYRMSNDRTEQVSSIGSSWRKWRRLSYIRVPPYSSVEVSLLLRLRLISLRVLTLSIPPLSFCLPLLLPSFFRYTRTSTQVPHSYIFTHISATLSAQLRGAHQLPSYIKCR